MSTIWVARRAVLRAVDRRVTRTGIVVDIGPGIRPQAFFRPDVHICAEPFRPYIDRVREGNDDAGRFVYLNCTWDAALAMFPDKSVDSVFALDVIEHLSKEEGRELLREAERVAREQVIVHTPLGFFPQHGDSGEATDRWGMDGGAWQTHRSGWAPEDFQGRWDFICCRHFHFLDEHERQLDEPVGAFWAFLNLGAESRSRAQRKAALRDRVITLLADRTRSVRKRLRALMPVRVD